MRPEEIYGLLRCPETRAPLHPCPLAEAESALGGGSLRAAVTAGPGGAKPIGPTPVVMLCRASRCAYPVVDGIPVLLVPEMLVPARDGRRIDLDDPKYREAYEEMAFYNASAQTQRERIEESASVAFLERALAAGEEQRRTFPAPREIWIDAVYDSAAQWDAYSHLAPVEGKRLLQLGGKGGAALRFLIAGASQVWLASPVPSELAFGRSIARRLGMEEKFVCVAAVAEQLPIADGTFDGIYSGGCVHHMLTELALPECARVLRDRGKFAAVEPWRAPFYALGTRLFGKREEEVHCRPITAARVRPLTSSFEGAEVVHHGALTRYPLLALMKLGLSMRLETVWRINRIDDTVTRLLPPLRRMGSSVALLGSKPPR